MGRAQRRATTAAAARTTALAQIAKLLTRAAEVDAVFDEVCDIAAAVLPLVSIVLLDDRDSSARTVAWERRTPSDPSEELYDAPLALSSLRLGDVGAETLGLLQVESQGELDDDDLAFTSCLASLIALALERAPTRRTRTARPPTFASDTYRSATFAADRLTPDTDDTPADATLRRIKSSVASVARSLDEMDELVVALGDLAHA